MDWEAWRAACSPWGCRVRRDWDWTDWLIQRPYCLCAQSCPTLFETPWSIAHYVPLSMEFFRQEYWSGLPFPSPGPICRTAKLCSHLRIGRLGCIGNHPTLQNQIEIEVIPLTPGGAWICPTGSRDRNFNYLGIWRKFSFFIFYHRSTLPHKHPHYSVPWGGKHYFRFANVRY